MKDVDAARRTNDKRSPEEPPSWLTLRLKGFAIARQIALESSVNLNILGITKLNICREISVLLKFKVNTMCVIMLI